MAQQQHIEIADQRAATPQLRWLALRAPDLARSARPGQYLLVRCSEPGSYDPLLRRPLFIAAADERLGQVGLLYAPDERGLHWLARGRQGDTLDVLGLFGHPFAVDRRTRNLLLIGEGPGLAALLLVAQQAVARGVAVTLLAGASAAALLPPAFLLPDAVEYQNIVGPAIDLLTGPQTSSPSAEPPIQTAKSKRQKSSEQPDSPPPRLAAAASPLLGWADQICAALPEAQVVTLRDAVQAAKYRWERGFASVLREGPLVCGVGACGACALDTRHGTRLLCSDGPVFDLRDV